MTKKFENDKAVRKHKNYLEINKNIQKWHKLIENVLKNLNCNNNLSYIIFLHSQ